MLFTIRGKGAEVISRITGLPVKSFFRGLDGTLIEVSGRAEALGGGRTAINNATETNGRQTRVRNWGLPTKTIKLNIG